MSFTMPGDHGMRHVRWSIKTRFLNTPRTIEVEGRAGQFILTFWKKQRMDILYDIINTQMSKKTHVGEKNDFFVGRLYKKQSTNSCQQKTMSLN